MGTTPSLWPLNTTYGNGEMLHCFWNARSHRYMRIKEARIPKGTIGTRSLPTTRRTIAIFCPQGKRLNYIGINQGNRTPFITQPRKRFVATVPAKAAVHQGHLSNRPPCRTNRIGSVPTRSPRHSLPRRREHGAKVEALFGELKKPDRGCVACSEAQ